MIRRLSFFKSIKAGKRIYYLDVKKNRKDEMFLAITESKKIVMSEGDDSQVSFENIKSFLYKEDLKIHDRTNTSNCFHQQETTVGPLMIVIKRKA